MKKFPKLSLLFLSLTLIAATAIGQPTTINLTTNGLSTGGYTKDTLGASETGLVKLSFGQKYTAGIFVGTGLKISGTPSATMILQASNDNVEWGQINVADTLFITNVAGGQSKVFKVAPMTYKYLRLWTVSAAGTQSFSIRGTVTLWQ